MPEAQLETGESSVPSKNSNESATRHMLDDVHDSIAESQENRHGMVTGIGGVFFKSSGDSKALGEWYKEFLGLNIQDSGLAIIELSDNEKKNGSKIAWEAFPKDSQEFAPSKSDFMIDYHVDNLDEMYNRLKKNDEKNGTNTVDEPISDQLGKFLRLRDPDGNNVELFEPVGVHDSENGRGKVTGIGGVFFKSSADSKVLGEWYKEFLGMPVQDSGLALINLSDDEKKHESKTIWEAFPKETKEFEPSKSDFMINYKVDNLDEIYDRLKKNDPKTVDVPISDEFGKFVRVRDPEGHNVELWQPIVQNSAGK